MQGAFEGCSPERPGRLLEPCGNARPRWMVATAVRATGRGTEPGSQAHLSTTLSLRAHWRGPLECQHPHPQETP